MIKCDEMKKGDIFNCQNCGFELMVNGECQITETCNKNPYECTLACCGRPMAKKKN